MAVTLQELINRTRDYLADWEYEDRLNAIINNSQTTLVVTHDGSRFASGDIIQIESEMMYVQSVSTNTLTVRRGWRRTTAASHSSGVTVLRNTNWTDDQLKRWVNDSFGDMYPKMYVRQTSSLTGSSTTYDYSLPADLTESAQIEKVEAKYGATPARVEVASAQVRGEPPALYVPHYLAGHTLTVTYIKPFGVLAALTDNCTLPSRAENLPVYFACARALEQNEVKRVRFDNYEVVQNERVAREGANINAGAYYSRLYSDLLNSVRMPHRGSIRGG